MRLLVAGSLSALGFALIWLLLFSPPSRSNSSPSLPVDAVPRSVEVPAESPRVVTPESQDSQTDRSSRELSTVSATDLLCQQYADLLNGDHTDETFAQLQAIIDQIAELPDKREARDLFCRLVELHGETVFDQKLSVLMSRHHMDFCSENPKMYGESVELLDPDNPRATYLFANACKVGYEEGVLDDSFSEKMFSTFLESSDSLLRLQLLGLLPCAGRDELAIEAYATELFDYKGQGESTAAVVFQGFSRLLQRQERSDSPDPTQAVRSREAIETTTTDFLASETLSYMDWLVGWTFVSERERILAEVKTTDTNVLKDVEYRRARMEAEKKRPALPGMEDRR